MALVAAAVCPHPPLLIPAVGVGVDVAARAAAQQATARLVAAEPDLVVVVGDGPDLAWYGPADSGSLAGYGVAQEVPLGAALDAGSAVLPLSITVGAWLLRGTGWTGDRQGRGVPESIDVEEAAEVGAALAELDDRVALLCMGDGSARRSEKAPGWFDPRAEPFDATVAAALAEADLDALLGLEPALARDLLAVGRASWQVLAAAAAGVRWQAEVTCDEAPFGVGYLVASWSRGAGG
jgi:hypothetical protein